MSIRFRTPLASLAALAAVSGALAFAPHAGAAESTPAKAENVSASSCFGSAKGYFKGIENGKFYPGGGQYYKTTSACSAVWIKPKTNRYVAVCLKNGGCRGSKLARAGKWTALETNLKTGNQYYFSFRSTARSTGQYAA